jgi:exo-1,4-beta-D-glucosaminidase
MRRLCRWFVFGLSVVVVFAVRAPADDNLPILHLRDGWAIQSSDAFRESGEVISTPRFVPRGWVPATVPTTVLGALVDAGRVPDPYYGTNLQRVPGGKPFGLDVSLSAMPMLSPYRHPWWYRRTFHLPPSFAGQTIWLELGGVNYRANVWLNGRLVAGLREIAGPFRRFALDITDAAAVGGTNCLAIEVLAPTLFDLSYNWVDWSPAPPDRNVGLVREVKISASGPVVLRHPFVQTALDRVGYRWADLAVIAEATNATAAPVHGVLHVSFEGRTFSQSVQLEANEARLITFAPDDYPALHVTNPRVWWPARWGPQNMYDLQMRFEVGGAISDRQAVRFGVRHIGSRFTAEGYRVFQINGHDLLVRGAGWSPDLLLRSSPARTEAELQYALDLGLNVLRLEGKPETEEFMSRCDELGLLVISGWCCCDLWEFWPLWDDEDRRVAMASLRDQITHLRNHPSATAWFNGSDWPPPASVEREYVRILHELRWPNPVLSSASETATSVTGRTGVKMRGPYDYVPPEYWYTDTARGGAFGFNTETGPGPAPPPVESLRRMLPKKHHWPIDAAWRYHAGRFWFGNLDAFNRALDQRFGTAGDLETYARRAQVLAYDTHRAMFEAYGRNKYRSTGVIQWLLNNPWPSLIWHLYDHYLRPGGSYFGAKKALEPLHVQYSYDDRSVVVVNSLRRPFPGLRVSARVVNLDMSEKFARQVTVDVPADGVVRAFVLPEPADLSRTYFVRLALHDADGQAISHNFYWLSTRPVVMDWSRADQHLTPTTQDADLTGLNSLPVASVSVPASVLADEDRDGERRAMVRVKNSSARLAFFVRVRLMRGRTDDEVLPIRWSDNYLSLMPGEERELTARFLGQDLRGHPPVIKIDGWNVRPFIVPIP